MKKRSVPTKGQQQVGLDQVFREYLPEKEKHVNAIEFELPNDESSLKKDHRRRPIHWFPRWGKHA